MNATFATLYTYTVELAYSACNIHITFSYFNGVEGDLAYVKCEEEKIPRKHVFARIQICRDGIRLSTASDIERA